MHSGQPQTVHSSDKLLLRLHEALATMEELERRQSPFVSIDELTSAAAAAKHRAQSAASALGPSASSTPITTLVLIPPSLSPSPSGKEEKTQKELLAALQQDVETCVGLAYGEGAGGPPQLTMPMMQGNMNLLESNLDALARGLKRVAERIRSTASELEADALKRQQQLFMDRFFNDPNSLAAGIEGLRRSVDHLKTD